MRPSETKIPTFTLASRRYDPDVQKQEVSEVENFSLTLVSASHIILWSHRNPQTPVLGTFWFLKPFLNALESEMLYYLLSEMITFNSLFIWLGKFQLHT